MNYAAEKAVLQLVRDKLQTWADAQSHDRCHYHPELFRDLCELLCVQPSVPIIRPPRAELEFGCRKFLDEEFATISPPGSPDAKPGRVSFTRGLIGELLCR